MLNVTKFSGHLKIFDFLLVLVALDHSLCCLSTIFRGKRLLIFFLLLCLLFFLFVYFAGSSFLTFFLNVGVYQDSVLSLLSFYSTLVPKGCLCSPLWFHLPSVFIKPFCIISPDGSPELWTS